MKQSALTSLAGFLDRLADSDFKAGEWISPGRSADGVISMPYVSLGKVAKKFNQAAYDDQWLDTKFDWPKWAQTAKGRKLRDDPRALAAASPQDLSRLLTVCIRQEKYSDGALMEAFNSGLILGIVRRAHALISDEAHVAPDPVGTFDDAETRVGQMTLVEAARKLAEMYRKGAAQKEQETQIHLFAIMYADTISGMSLSELLERAGLPDSYRTELRKGINLAKYVRSRD